MATIARCGDSDDASRSRWSAAACRLPGPPDPDRRRGRPGPARAAQSARSCWPVRRSCWATIRTRRSRPETIRDGWLHTGDLGYLSDGELFVCGRAKDIIIVNGRKYHPQDLEWAVDDLAGVRRGRVVAFGTTERGQPDRVVIVVEPSGTVPADALTDAIRRRIGDLFGLLRRRRGAGAERHGRRGRRAARCSARRRRRATSAASS